MKDSLCMDNVVFIKKSWAIKEWQCPYTPMQIDNVWSKSVPRDAADTIINTHVPASIRNGIRDHHEDEGNLTQVLLLQSPQLRVWLKEKMHCSPGIQWTNVSNGVMSFKRTLTWDKYIPSGWCWLQRTTYSVYQVGTYMMTSSSMKSYQHSTNWHTYFDYLYLCCLPISQWPGQAYNGVGNMNGYLNGVVARI